MSIIMKHTGGYDVTKYEALSTGAFSCIITRDRKPVAAVRNDGRGGCDIIDSIPNSLPDQRGTRAALHGYAESLFGEFEPIDAFVLAILTAQDMLRASKRTKIPSAEFVEPFIAHLEQSWGYAMEEPNNALLRAIAAETA